MGSSIRYDRINKDDFYLHRIERTDDILKMLICFQTIRGRGIRKENSFSIVRLFIVEWTNIFSVIVGENDYNIPKKAKTSISMLMQKLHGLILLTCIVVEIFLKKKL